METQFIYWRHILPCGVKVEEISGAEDRSGAVWRALAKQVYCENGRDGFRQLDHLECGAPLLCDEQTRISVTHTEHLLAVASLPRTPEADLSRFGVRTALGIDAESEHRGQVLKVRDKFLSDDELAIVAPDDLAANITAWTCKEALYKAALCPGIDLRAGLRITVLPVPDSGVAGSGAIIFPDGKEEAMELFSYRSEGCVITVAYSPRCAKYKKS